MVCVFTTLSKFDESVYIFKTRANIRFVCATSMIYLPSIQTASKSHELTRGNAKSSPGSCEWHKYNYALGEAAISICFILKAGLTTASQQN